MKKKIVRRNAVFPSSQSRRRRRHRDTNNTNHPHDGDFNTSNENVLDRVCLHGGQITFATIRFPSIPTVTCVHDDVGSLDADAATVVMGGVGRIHEPINKEVDENGDDHFLRKNGGRIVFARGPWIESHPLVRSNFGHAHLDDHVYKILAFGQGGGNYDSSVGSSSKLECVRGMIFPSSSTSSSSAASIIAYGGRRISFLYGGGLYRNNHPPNRTVPHGEDDFGCIPINSNGWQCSYLAVSDWVHDIRMIPIIIEQRASCSTTESSTTENFTAPVNTGRLALLNNNEDDILGKHCFLLAMGMANNSCEIWGFRPILHSTPPGGISLHPSRLQCITCDIRCMTYSLSFHGWDCEKDDVITVLRRSKQIGDGDDCKFEREMYIVLPKLTAASGTVFGDVVVWNVVDNLLNTHMSTSSDDLQFSVSNWLLLTNDFAEKVATERPRNATLRTRSSPMICLKGHLGSVLRVKFSSCGNFVASTSDDRTVRLWGKMPMNNTALKHNAINDQETNDSTHTRSTTETLALNSSHEWGFVWTGWGHTARVLDVSFASSSNHQEHGKYPILVSAGEDGTARIWNPLMSEKEITQPLRGHRCGSIWSVAVCRDIVITGGNDGSVKLYELESRMNCNGYNSMKLFVVPQDDNRTIGNGVTYPVCDAEEQSSQTVESKLPKKKKKKTKLICSAQSICGMEFYGSTDKVHSKLLIATKSGGLFSLDLTTSDWTDYGSWSEHVVTAYESNRSMSIDPMSGSCIGVHTSGKSAIVGTSEGWLVISSIGMSNPSSAQDLPATSCKTNVSFQVPSYRPVQSVSYIDDKGLIVFYARSVIWFHLDPLPSPIHILTMGTTGIPLSFAYDCRDNAMYIGDSRGNVAYFNLNQEINRQSDKVNELRPHSMLTTVHEKEHVTGITILESSGVVISVGNDGCVHRFRRDKSNNQLQKLTSIPVPNATGLRHVWNVPDPDGGERVIIGGYYGNEFVILDPILGYEFLRVDTGGRQKRQDLFVRFHNNTASIMFGIAVLEGWENGFNSIAFHSSHSFLSTLANVEPSGDDRVSNHSSYSIGSPLHAEINDTCWIGDVLLTGSNDCTVTLSKFDGRNLVSISELPPHESCVRGVCSSCHQDSCFDLLVTCGGKLSMQFYLLDITSSVSFLCSYRTLAKTTIDHRMNAVRATPIFSHAKRCHLVVAGDSDGNLHVCFPSEYPLPRRTIIGTILQGNGRPVLCLELLRFSDRILVCVGTTGGEITIWVVDDMALDGILPKAPIFSYRAHQTGVNDISAAAIDNGSDIVICTVGDDQSLSTCVLRFPDSSRQPDASLVTIAHLLLITECASASALKAVHLVMDSSSFDRIYTTGHDRQLTLWRLNIGTDEISVKFVSSSPLGTEGTCIDCVCRAQEDGSVYEVVAVGGEGVEVQSFNRNALHAAYKLHTANYLLITTGAGFSSDSGLQTYESAPSEYREMCNPSKLVDNPTRFQQFWLDFTKSYLETKPHIGYDLLDQWCEGGRLPHLRRSTYDLGGSSDEYSVPWWVYSSNVDCHFHRFSSFPKALCEIHGSALEFRCACGIGYANGEPRIGNMWDQWNQSVASCSDICKHTILKMSLDLLCDRNNPNTPFLCDHCRQPMRPNVLMFHDTDENVLNSIDLQRDRYQTWEGHVEDEIVRHGANFVILEMGCGVNVPAVRQESEEVLIDCAKKIVTHGNAGSVCLIRINPKDATIELDGGLYDLIPIASTAAAALRKIDCWLEALTY